MSGVEPQTESVAAPPVDLVSKPAARRDLLRRRTDSFLLPAGLGAGWSRRLGRDRAFLLGGGLIAALLIMATVLRLFWTADPTVVDLGKALSSPSLAHPMGTDSYGRDILARFDE